MDRSLHLLPFPRAALAVVAVGLVFVTPVTALAWPGCEVDWFFLSATDDTVTVDHNGVSYNCCMDYVQWEVDLSGSTLRIFEYEITPVPCACICCFELSVSVADCPPGPLDVEVHWNDWDSGEWETWTGTIVVPDVGQVPLPVIASNETSDCLPYGTGAPTPEGASSWAVLKAWYRTR